MNSNSTMWLAAYMGATCLGQPLPEMRHTDAEWDALWQQALRERVGALLYDAVSALPTGRRPRRELLYRMAGYADQVEQHQLRLREARTRLTELMPLLGDTSAVVEVKGAALAALYPNPLHRECSDIDLYVWSQSEETHHRTVAALNQLPTEVVMDRRNARHTVLRWHGTSTELHWYLLYKDADNALLEQYLRPRGTFDEVAHALFLAAHTDYHATFFDEAIPMRALLDWVLLTGQPDFDREKLFQLCSCTEAGLFAEALSAYCDKLFHTNIYEKSTTAVSVVECFADMYRDPRPRASRTALRVARRLCKYARFRPQYRRLYGKGMLRRFYWNNLTIALRQRVQGQRI